MKRKPMSLPDLIDIIKHIWIEEITVDYCQKPDSMPRRNAFCRENKGPKNINY